MGTAPETEPGSGDEALDDLAIVVLRKLTEIYTGVPRHPNLAATTHYDAYFRYWTKQRPSFRKVVQTAVARLERTAQGVTGQSFAECEAPRCLRLIRRAFRGKGELEVFERSIQRSILKVYAETDAWIDMGYESWRGKPRGLDVYRQPPTSAGRVAE